MHQDLQRSVVRAVVWTAVAAVHALAASLPPCRRQGSSAELEVREGVGAAQAGGLIRTPGLLLVGSSLALVLPRWLQLHPHPPVRESNGQETRHPVVVPKSYAVADAGDFLQKADVVGLGLKC